MRTSLLSTLLFILGTGISSAQVLDQQSLPPINSAWLVNSAAYTSAGQSFTAGMDGTLSSIVIHLENSSGPYPLIAGTFSLTVRDGDGYGGTILATESFSITGSEPYGDFAIPISTTVNVTSGNVYTFIIQETSGTGQLNLNANGNAYAGGIMYSSVFTNPPTTYTNYDMLFKTYVVSSCTNTASTITESAICSYTSPSGNYLWTASGTYNDTIPNAEGCDSVITVNLTIDPLSDQAVSAAQSHLCDSGSTTVDIASSQAGALYYLRDDANDTIVDGPVVGTGSAMSLNTGMIQSNMTYNIYAEKPGLDSAVSLPATEDFIRVDAPFTAYGSEMTIETWVYSDGLEMPWAGQSGEAVDVMATNVWLWHAGAFIVNLNGSWQQATMPQLSAGWHHVATVAQSDSLKVYYDGVLVESTAVSVSGIQNAPTSVVDLGQDPRFAPNSGRNSNSAFDEFRIWDHARTQVEIDAGRNSCLTGSETGLVQYVKFNQVGDNIIEALTGGEAMIVNNTMGNWIAGAGVCQEGGCDLEMTQTATITVGQNNTGSEAQTACDSYTWSADNNTYTSTGTYTATLTNVAGCDSVVTLNLTIGVSNTGSETITACDSYTWSADNNTYTSTGTYMATLTNMSGCDSVVTLDLTINTVDVSVTDASPTFTANATGASFQWMDCGNGYAVLNGETNAAYTASVNGTYAVEVTQNGCTDTSSCLVAASVGMEELSERRFSILPNPNNGEFTISLGGSHGGVLTVLNSAGQVIHTDDLASGKNRVRMEMMEAGVYFVRVSSADKVEVIRMLVK